MPSTGLRVLVFLIHEFHAATKARGSHVTKMVSSISLMIPTGRAESTIIISATASSAPAVDSRALRSEERRVGKEYGLRLFDDEYNQIYVSQLYNIRAS